jgi:4-amino-4-deoxy-L-arabinose transferase-like glycosyltransferase
MRPRNAWLVLLLLTVIIRLPYLLDGGQPYVSAVDRKPPLLFYTYAAFFGLVGKYNFIGLHVISLLWVCATMGVLYVVARRLFDWRVGIVAAFFYSVFQPAGDYRNQAMNGEMLMNLPIVPALGLVFIPGRRRIRPELLAAGALLAVAFLYKQPAAIAAVPMGLYLLLPSYRTSRGLHLGHSLLHGALLIIGFATALGLSAWWLHYRRHTRRGSVLDDPYRLRARPLGPDLLEALAVLLHGLLRPTDGASIGVRCCLDGLTSTRNALERAYGRV